MTIIYLQESIMNQLGYMRIIAILLCVLRRACLGIIANLSKNYVCDLFKICDVFLSSSLLVAHYEHLRSPGMLSLLRQPALHTPLPPPHQG